MDDPIELIRNILRFAIIFTLSIAAGCRIISTLLDIRDGDYKKENKNEEEDIY